MNVLTTRLEGLVLLEPKVFQDERGTFMETYQASRYAGHGIEESFVQDNLSRSEHGVLRGLHFQHPHPQGKLVQVLEGEVFDVALDVRQGSPTFGEWEGFALSAANHHQLYIPPGFAHGFCVTSPWALFFYKCTDLYHPECESTILWDDPALSISWAVEISAVSQKDREGVRLGDMDLSLLPRY